MAKALVITGTSSGAGKSFIVSALGRLLKKRGYNVCPFKAQNMSLQSYVTLDGGEIGIAQALQAMACKLEPEVHFNPILLKPQGEDGSQVIIQGKVYKTLKAKEYYKEKNKLWEKVRESLNYLKEKYEVILIEGAGSPAEINLLEKDLVNIEPPLYLKAPVILVGDIERGGVFASLYGTFELLKRFKKEYASLFCGFLINKFRGEISILEPGIKSLEKLIGLPCFGVLPFSEKIPIPDEDSLALPQRKEFLQFKKESIKIVVLRLRYISNFSDFEPLKLEPDVELIYSLREEDLLSADIIIIPGSKKTIGDLKELKKLGVDKVLNKALKEEKEIIGICGGFQILGEIIKDPYKAESNLKEIKALGFLEIETIFNPEKITSQVIAEPISPKDFNINAKLWGYEIHKGESKGDLNLFKIKRIATKEVLRDGSKKGNVWGTYLHGIFTNDEFRRSIINKHRIKKGLKPIFFTYSYKEYLENGFELMAEFLEKHLDINRILQIIEK